MKQRQKQQVKSRLYTSILLVLLSLAAVTAVTVAWFSIADNTRVRTMSLDIVSDVDMRMDLDAHETIEDYVRTLSFADIDKRIQQEKGFSMQEKPLEPVTTQDTHTFTFENGSVVESTSGAYLEFTLHFMAEKDLLVHLTSTDGQGGDGGTNISSNNPQLPEAMRISFEADGMTWIYDPGMGDASNTSGNMKVFGLPDASNMQNNDNNLLFSLKEGEDKTVQVHIWLEGTDPACTDELRNADYAIWLRFTGERIEDET